MKIELLAAVLIAALGSPAQTLEKPKPAKETATIEGRVTEAGTNLPVAGVEVRVGFSGAPVSAKTDDEGRYQIEGLAPGEYTILLRKEGYDRIADKRIRVRPGQRRGKIDIQVHKQATITGRVLDDEKNPVPGALMQTWQSAYRDGRPVMVYRGGSRTNDLGEYRITGLGPGKYYVAATRLRPAVQRSTLPDEAALDRAPQPAVIPTFYPSAPAFELASPIHLGSGEQREAADVVLIRTDTYCVYAAVGGKASGSAAQTVVDLSAYSSNGWSSSLAAGRVRPGEEFQICGVPRGSYTLWAVVPDQDGQGGTAAYATTSLTISKRHVRLRAIEPVPGMKIQGRVQVADAKPEDKLPEGIRIWLERWEPRYHRENTRGSVTTSGRFEIPHIFPDQFWLKVFGLPGGYYIKQATAGGPDIRGKLFWPGGDIRILLGSDGPVVSGKVVDEEDQAVADARVVVAPASLPLEGGPGIVFARQTDQSGEFDVSGFAPGEYRLFAFRNARGGEEENPDFLRQHLSKAMEVKLEPGEKKSVTVKVRDAHP